MKTNLELLFKLDPHAAFDQDPDWVFNHDEKWVAINKVQWINTHKSEDDRLQLFFKYYPFNPNEE